MTDFDCGFRRVAHLHVLGGSSEAINLVLNSNLQPRGSRRTLTRQAKLHFNFRVD